MFPFLSLSSLSLSLTLHLFLKSINISSGEDLKEKRFLGPTDGRDSVGWGLSTCISNKVLGGGDAADPTVRTAALRGAQPQQYQQSM